SSLAFFNRRRVSTQSCAYNCLTTGRTSFWINSAAVWPKRRCSSVRSSRVKISSGPTRSTRNRPPAAACGPVVMNWTPEQLTTHRTVVKYMPLPDRTISELFDLSGRSAIVTGGSRGLGREMAEGLAEAGASLMLCARREEWLTPTVAEFRARGFTVEGMVCDVAQPDQVEAVVNRTVAAYGRVDILVNNAGVS